MSESRRRLPVVCCTVGVFPQQVGGMQKHSRRLVETLAARGHCDLEVVHPHAGEDPVFPGLEAVREHALPPLRDEKTYLRECWRYSARVLEILREFPDHVVYSQGIAVWKGLDEVGARTIVNPHGLEAYQPLTVKDRLLGWPYRAIFDWQMRRAARVVSLGGHLTTILRRRVPDPERVVVLPNAADAVPDAGAKSFDGPLRLLFVGRFAHNKGIVHLLEAARRLSTTGEDVHLDLVGKGPLYDQLRAAYALPNVTFHGFASDEELDRLYRDDHLFVLPTLFEGMPTVVLEAMARGMPILVTDVGATREMVDESNGFILEKESPDSILDAVERFRALPAEARTAMSRASLQRLSERFTWDAVAAAHEELFAELLRVNPPGSRSEDGASCTAGSPAAG